MKRLALLFLLLLAAPTAGLGAFAIFQTAAPSAVPNPNLRQENFFGLTGSAWQTPSTYYVPGTGNPAVSTADYYHSDGAYWLRPYDLLDSACGSAGSTIAATAGKGRYVWMMSPDHASGGTPWADGQGLRLGFSNDPGVPPATMNLFSPYSVTALPRIADVTSKIDNGSGGAGNILTVTAVTGAISFDNNAVVNGTGVTQANIVSQASGTPAGIGTYTIDGAAQNVASRSMTISQTNYYLYATPFLACNPDDVSNTFYVYAEGSGNRTLNQTGLMKSNDLVTWTAAVPTHIVYTFGPFSSYQRIVRTGVNAWYSTGFQAGYPQTSNAFGYAKWTSADGLNWAPNPTTLFSMCLPTNASGVFGAQPCTATTATFSQPSGGPPRITVGANDWSISNTNTVLSGTRTGSQWVTRAPIDSNFNILSSPAVVNVSSAYGGTFPGPTYINETSGYVEDGIAHYYTAVGFPPSNSNTGTISGATYANGGGLWQQGKDYHTEIVDSSAAATAAPIGVKASCASSVASLTWFNALPQQTYRLYRGTTAGSQTTLVGDFTGTTATDSGMTLNAVTYYKLVYLHSGVEQKNRVVNTYCSSSIYLEVNAHLTRASAGGADMSTCDRTFMDTFYAWLTSNGLKNNLLFAATPETCVAKSGSVITKIFDMGTTRLPRGGDYTPTSSNTTYNATGVNGKPAWVDTTSAYGYYGGGRYNNIRRKTQITMFAAYQKPGTAILTPFVSGQFSVRMMLSHTAGTPGGAEFRIYDATQTKTATATISGLATDVHTLAGTYDSVNGLLVYADAVAGSAQTGLVIPSPDLNATDALTGMIDNNVTPTVNWNTIMSGTDAGLFNPTSGYSNAGNAAAASNRAKMIFDVKLTGAQITSLDALVR